MRDTRLLRGQTGWTYHALSSIYSITTSFFIALLCGFRRINCISNEINPKDCALELRLFSIYTLLSRANHTDHLTSTDKFICLVYSRHIHNLMPTSVNRKITPNMYDKNERLAIWSFVGFNYQERANVLKTERVGGRIYISISNVSRRK